jgi:cytochrome c oxidase cbb3-type subunit II
MPGYPYLFALRERAEKDEVIVIVPGAPGAPAVGGRVVVATQEALDLVSYLRSLDRSYSVDTAGQAPNGKK